MAKKVWDFSNVQERNWNPKHMEAGDYKAKITKAVEDETEDGDYRVTYVCALLADPKATYPYRCPQTANQLWKMRNILTAAGKQVPQKRINVDSNAPVGSIIGITLSDNEYGGNLRSQIDAVFPADEVVEDEDDEEEEEAPPPAKKSTAKKTAAKKTSSSRKESEEEDEDEDEDEDELDLDSL